MDKMNQYEINPKRILSRIGLGLFLMTAAIIVANFAIDFSVHRFLPSIWSSDWYAWAVTAISVIGVALPVLVISLRNLPSVERGEVVKLSFTQFIVIFFICVAAMYLTNYIGVIINFYIATVKGEDIINPAADAVMNSNYIITFLYGALVAPIAEEVIFRKVLLDKLRPFGDLPACLLTGFAFGLFHMNLAQFFYASALGMIFAYITIKTNTIRYSILLHIIINTIGISASPLAKNVKENLGLIMLMGVWVIVAITLGILFFALNVKKIKFLKGITPLEKKSDYFLNYGTILYVIICLIMTVRVILL
ncbi:MAG TPA: type II CAAX endopeptidase family protein [Mobilitalea sp.]|nr:type II CAAX endopeptidase family protein [Mobilitalea sp.]